MFFFQSDMAVVCITFARRVKRSGISIVQTVCLPTLIKKRINANQICREYFLTFSESELLCVRVRSTRYKSKTIAHSLSLFGPSYFAFWFFSLKKKVTGVSRDFFKFANCAELGASLNFIWCTNLRATKKLYNLIYGVVKASLTTFGQLHTFMTC